jgi:hypothetical protein
MDFLSYMFCSVLFCLLNLPKICFAYLIFPRKSSLGDFTTQDVPFLIFGATRPVLCQKKHNGQHIIQAKEQETNCGQSNCKRENCEKRGIQDDLPQVLRPYTGF